MTPMNSDLIELLAAFQKNGVRYLIVGGYAVGFHAEPRYTKDCDIWISTDRKNAQAVYDTLKHFGAPLFGTTPDDFQRDNEFFFFGQPPNRIDLLMGPPGDVEFNDAWNARNTAHVEGIDMYYISREHLILLKRAANRDIDKSDIKKLIDSDPDKQK